VVEDNCACVRVVAGNSQGEAWQMDSAEDTVKWQRMEELALAEAGNAPMVFRPTIPVFSQRTSNFQGPVIALSGMYSTYNSKNNGNFVFD